MALSSGTRLGPYEILSPIGAGGMGEVYKAHDTRLERTVAIKVLPEHISQREDLRLRFEREARAVAAFNHPNICVIHDIGSQDGHGYMVMEFMEGETLSERLQRGALPLEQAISFAIQIAGALDRAHRAGVAHRDTKPGNIMVTRDGVKVLDFGLAKTNPKPGLTEDTVTQAITAEGTIVGTPQYMAPEQFNGSEADARADIWAFGAVLSEMLTGKKAFEGKSYTSLVGAILMTDPPPVTPAWLDRVVQRCLAKDPERRYQSMRDVQLDLESPAVSPETTTKPSRWPLALAALFGLLAIGAWILVPRASTEKIVFEMTPPPGAEFTDLVLNNGGSAISPDGKTVAVVITPEKGKAAIHVRPIHALDSRALTGTEDASRPFWSPDSKSIGFVAEGKLKRIDVAGGSPVVICDASVPRGASWNEDGLILLAHRELGIQSVPASGGTPKLIVPVDVKLGNTRLYYPHFLPGGKQFLFLAHNIDRSKSGIFLAGLDGKTPVKLISTEWSAAYDAPSKNLLFIKANGVLLARKLELNPPSLVGDSFVVAENIRGRGNNGYADFSVSKSGTLFYGRGDFLGASVATLRDRSGNLMEKVGEPIGSNNGIRLSPDNTSAAYWAFSLTGNASGLWVLDLKRGLSSLLAPSSATNTIAWSANGQHVYFNTPTGLMRKAVNGGGEAEFIRKSFTGRINSVSSDGKFLIYDSIGDAFLLELAGNKQPVPILNSSFGERHAMISPDGRWLAFCADDSGRFEVYLQTFPEGKNRIRLSANGGLWPRWRGDGKELFWIEPNFQLVATTIEYRDSEATVTKPRNLFLSSLAGGEADFSVSGDGQRFLLQEPVGKQISTSMVVAQNWAANAGK